VQHALAHYTFLKLLCDVGRQSPGLFENALRPLLVSPEVLYWDIDVRLQGRGHLMIGADLKGDWFAQLAHDFNNLEHRTKDLRNVGVEMMFNRPLQRPFFEQARQAWESRLAVEQNEEMRVFLEALIIWFDPNSYNVRDHPEHGPVIVNTRAEDVAAERATEYQQQHENLLVMTFGGRCRELLDTGQGLPAERVEPFWDDLQHIYAARERPDAPWPQGMVDDDICGGAAVLLRFHQGWLEQNQGHMAWCLDQLKQVIVHPPQPGFGDVPESAFNMSWDCFASDVVPMLWAQDPQEPDLRTCVALLAFARHYRAVATLFARCAEHRVVLGEDFTRLRRLLFERAYVDGRTHRVRYWMQSRHDFLDGHDHGPNQDLVERFVRIVDEWVNTRIIAFIDGDLPSELTSWHDADDPERFREIDAHLPKWCLLDYRLDFQLICEAHSWLPTPDKAHSDVERSEWLAFWRQALTHIVGRTEPTQAKQQDSLVPHPEERWVLHGIAAAVPYMRPEENPERLWQVVLDLRPEASYWVEEFLQSFHRAALQAASVPEGYVALVRAMFDFADASATWPTQESAHHGSRGSVWHYGSDPWRSLLGLDGWTQERWQERHTSIIRMAIDLFQRWTTVNLKSDRCVQAWARFLERPAAQPILLQGIQWLEDAAAATHGHLIERDDSANAIASLLTTAWSDHQAELRSNRSALLALLSLLVVRITGCASSGSEAGGLAAPEIGILGGAQRRREEIHGLAELVDEPLGRCHHPRRALVGEVRIGKGIAPPQEARLDGAAPP